MSSILAATRRFGASIRILDSRREAIHIKMNAAALPLPLQPAISPPCFVLRARFVMRSLNFHPAARAARVERGWKDHIGVSRSETITRSRALSNFHAGEIRAGTERPRYSSGDLIRRSHAILFAEGYTFVRTARVLVSGGGEGGGESADDFNADVYHFASPPSASSSRISRLPLLDVHSCSVDTTMQPGVGDRGRGRGRSPRAPPFEKDRKPRVRAPAT